ncbi:hypothetical protein PQR66_19365 [Paraburkholderia agricolaris]|uniref:Secreted protein n=1 Tax=Paraburkholderia agricolaris TaxID=2152888 RepID=A0ABW8ZSR8_9BURK
MEGIRRIGIVIKAVALIWFVGFLIGAGVSAIGNEVQMTSAEMDAVYDHETGRNIEADAEAQTTWPNGKPTDSLEAMMGATSAHQRIINQFFSNRSQVVRRRDWGSVLICVVVGVVGAAILGALGWIVAGFAVKRGAP